MSQEEMDLYSILFPNDNNPNYINYAYYTGGTLNSLYMLKSRINNSPIGPIFIADGKNDGSFFVRVLQKDVETFLDIVKHFKFKQIDIPNYYKNQIRLLFGDIR